MSSLASIAHKNGFSIGMSATISDAMAVMLGNKNGSVVLLDDGYPVGVVSESSLLTLLEEDSNLSQPIQPIANTPVITAHKSRPMEFAFDLIITNNIRRLVLVDDDGAFSGVVLQEDLFSFLDNDVYKVDLKVADLLENDVSVITVERETDLYEVLSLMRSAKVGSVIVTDGPDQAVGIVTEKDIIASGYHGISMNQSVEKCMSSPVQSVFTDDAVTDVIDFMRITNIRRVLVKEADGSMRSLLTNRDIFKHIKGNVARMLEIKLRHNKEIMNLLPEPIIEIFDGDAEQVIHWINNKARDRFGENLLGNPPEALLGESWKNMYFQLERAGQIECFCTVVNGRNFEFSGTLSKNINSRYIKLIAKDVTEHEMMKRQLQEEIREEAQLRQEQEYLIMQQAKLASMGEMIGYIAHQWRQPLAQLGGIFMNLDSAYAFNQLDEDYLQSKIINGNDTIKYMSQTIDDFRLFFTPNESVERFDVVVILQQTLNIVSAGLNYYHIEVKIDAKPGSFFAHASASEFAQVVLNLLINAKDILSERVGVERYIDVSVSKEKDNIVLSFCDNGGGIDSSVMSDIFEPYVSTKHEKNGTGMGLYMSRRIIEQRMMGSICAVNETQGACFILTFPSA